MPGLRACLTGLFRGTRQPTSALQRAGASWERFGDVEGRQLHEVAPLDLSPDFREALKDICASDPTIVAVWIVWMTSSDAEPELLAMLALDRQEEHSIAKFLERASKLQGPTCVAALAGPDVQARPFYRRSLREQDD